MAIGVGVGLSLAQCSPAEQCPLVRCQGSLKIDIVNTSLKRVTKLIGVIEARSDGTTIKLKCGTRTPPASVRELQMCFNDRVFLPPLQGKLRLSVEDLESGERFSGEVLPVYQTSFPDGPDCSSCSSADVAVKTAP